jgi:hypothetical protein
VTRLRAGRRRNYESVSSVHTRCRAHSASYLMENGGFFAGGGGVKRSGPKPDQLPTTKTKTCSSPYVFMLWCLIKHRDNHTLTLFLVYLTTLSTPHIMWCTLYISGHVFFECFGFPCQFLFHQLLHILCSPDTTYSRYR